MSKLFENLKKHFEKIPKEQLDMEFEAIKYLNDIGINSEEWINAAIANYKERYKEYLENYKLIDLGLPSGTLWMDRNIGAISPTDCGLYFAWGDTTGYTADKVVDKTKQFNWTDYKYANGNYNKLTKYCYNPEYGNNIYTDSLSTLQTTDDAVLQNVHKCQMPTKEQIQELLYNTTYEWTTQNGVNGGLFTSKTNGNSIFIPADGVCGNGSVFNVGEYGGLWSSSLCEDDPYYAWCLYFLSGEVDCDYGNRFYGFPVRGVVGSVE